MNLFLPLLGTGLFLQLMAFFMYPYSYLGIRSNPIPLFLVLFFVGIATFFSSLVFLKKKKLEIVLPMVFGWFVALIIGIYLFRHNFYFVCRPYYNLETLEALFPKLNIHPIPIGKKAMGVCVSKRTIKEPQLHLTQKNSKLRFML